MSIHLKLLQPLFPVLKRRLVRKERDSNKVEGKKDHV
jgi:hypothetical protein